MIYRNRNYFNNTFRYKKVDENTSDYIGIEHSKRIIKYNETTSVNGKKFHYVPYDYHPRWLFKILWNFQRRFLLEYGENSDACDSFFIHCKCFR